MQDMWQVVFHGQGPIMSVKRLLGHFYKAILTPNHHIVKCNLLQNYKKPCNRL
jgi:hypothetical protein